MISNTLSYKKTVRFMMDPEFNMECKTNNDLVFSLDGITEVPYENLNIKGIKKNIFNLSGVRKIDFGNSFSRVFNFYDIFKIINVREMNFHFDKNIDDICYKKLLLALINPNNINYRNNIETINIVCNNGFIIKSTVDCIQITKNKKSNMYSLNDRLYLNNRINRRNLYMLLTNPSAIKCRFCLDLKRGCEWCNEEMMERELEEEYDDHMEHLNDCDVCGDNVEYIDEYGLCSECRKNKKIKHKIRRQYIWNITEQKNMARIKNKKFITFDL